MTVDTDKGVDESKKHNIQVKNKASQRKIPKRLIQYVYKA